MALARIPLMEPLESRSESFDKDGFSSNVFYDKDDVASYAVKRPGIDTNAFGIGAGLGIYYFDNELFIFQDVEAIRWTFAEVGNSTIVIKARGEVAGSNKLLVSTSPLNTWSGLTLPVDWDFTGLAFGNGVFVVSAQHKDGVTIAFPLADKFYYSTDGITWLESNTTSPSDYVIFLNTKFYAGASADDPSSVAKYSTDGITWTNYTGAQTPPRETATWNGTVYCDAFAVEGFSIQIRTSSDALTWTTQSPIAGAHDLIDGMASNTATGTMVIGERSNKVYYSTNNGVSWTQVTLPTIAGGDEIRQIRYINSLFITLTDAGGVHSSSDGITWSFKGYVTGSPSTNFGTFTFLNGVYVVIYSQAAGAALPESNWYYTSTDLITWTLDVLQEAQLPTIY